MAIKPGETLLHYRLIEKIGEGGMGEVWQATDTTLDREVAIKVLPDAFASDPQRLARFKREAKVLASLSHPGIAAIHGVHDSGGTHFLVMELVKGTPLDKMITEGGVPLDRVLEVAIPLADAIAFAHDQGIIHRDIKPSNVMLDASGRIRVLDFGVAGLTKIETEVEDTATVDVLTKTGEALGTPAYMAPEQLEGREADARADVFAIGVILYQLATGAHPFRGDSAAVVASAILRDEPASLTELRPDLPADFARVVRRCLDKRVDRRLQTVKDIRNELEDMRAGIFTGEEKQSAELQSRPESLVERTMVITAGHVRRLSVQNPRMVGDSMYYLDNERKSDVLVACVHGIGADQTDFEGALRRMPFRAVALSMYGFAESSNFRPPLPLSDHNQLLVFLLEEVNQRIPSSSQVLVGHSSGADQVLWIMASELGETMRPAGVILLGPQTEPGAGLVSGPLSRLTSDPADILKSIREMSAVARDLDAWLWLHDYLVQSFRKFGQNIEGLQRFAQDLIDAYERDEFFENFRTLTQRVAHVRCVFARDELDAADHAIRQHVRNNALGDRYTEDMISRESVGHIELQRASVLLPHVEDIVRRVLE